MTDDLEHDDFAWLDATAQAELVRSGRVSSVELTEAAIRRIERVNPALNAVILPLFDHALHQARTIDASDGADREAPFRGVPFLFKDLNDLDGVATSAGSRFFAGQVARKDSEIAARLRKAGFVFLGKTNTPELGLLPTTEPALFGPTRNPWHTERTAGGSSGGAAAAVASGLVAAAHANDGGGSIRIPASCCGLFGLKPTRGRTPGNNVVGLAVNHVVTRSVRDSASILDCVAGLELWSAFPLPPAERPFGELAAYAVSPLNRRLRIGFSTAAPTGAPLHADCVAAVHDAAKLLESLGHHVDEAQPTIDGDWVGECFMQVWASGCAASIEGRIAELGREPGPDELEPVTRTLLETGRKVSAAKLMAALAYLHRSSCRIARFFESYDVWLTPTLAEPPVPLGTFDPSNPSSGGDPMEVLKMTNAWVPFTPIINVTGQPAMSVPLYWNEEGLPIGTHFVGRFAEEATLLALAAELEAARPWAGRRPGVRGGGRGGGRAGGRSVGGAD